MVSRLMNAYADLLRLLTWTWSSGMAAGPRGQRGGRRSWTRSAAW